jgi:hypothetical protein
VLERALPPVVVDDDDGIDVEVDVIDGLIVEVAVVDEGPAVCVVLLAVASLGS